VGRRPPLVKRRLEHASQSRLVAIAK
jgi:hypothetical protein